MPKRTNNLDDGAGEPEAQDRLVQFSLVIPSAAVPRVERLAARRGLKPRTMGRILLLDALDRAEMAA